MKSLSTTTKYRKDFKRLRKQGKNFSKLQSILTLLSEDAELPASARPHKLSGEWEGIWECHIEPDWLLIYDTSPTEITLYRMGSHSDLFK